MLRAWASSNETEAQDRALVTDRVDSAYTDSSNQTVQGDVARVFDQYLERDSDQLESSYRPETYNTQELMESYSERETEDADAI